MKRILIGAFALAMTAVAFAATSFNDGPWKLYVSGTPQSADYATAGDCDIALRARANTQPLNVSRTYRCQRSTTAVRTADPPPQVVNCAGTWSEWTPTSDWGTCESNIETRTIQRTFNITQQPQNGGTACPASPEVDAEHRPCGEDPPPPPGNEVVGTWGNRVFNNGVPYRLNMADGAYPVWANNGATHTNMAGSWDGGNFARFTPPTGQGSYGAIGALAGINNPSGGDTKTLSIRYEFRTGPTFASSLRAANGHKFLIAHVFGNSLYRPMINMQGTLMDSLACVTPAVAAATVSQYNHKTAQADWWPNGRDSLRWCDSALSVAGTTVIPPGEWVTVELFIDVTNAATAKQRLTITRRDGQVPLNYEIPWTYDSNWGIDGNEDASEVQVLGGYYSNVDSRAGNHYDITGVTFTVNGNAPIGPRTGFVLQ